MMQLWFGISSVSKSAGCLNFCSHFQLFESYWKDEWSVTVFICLWAASALWQFGEHWPIEKVNMIKHRLSAFIQYSTTVAVLIFSVNSTRNECQYGAKEPREQPHRTSFHSVMKLIHTPSINCPMAPRSQLHYQCWFALNEQYFGWLQIPKEGENTLQKWSNFGQQKTGKWLPLDCPFFPVVGRV